MPEPRIIVFDFIKREVRYEQAGTVVTTASMNNVSLTWKPKL